MPPFYFRYRYFKFGYLKNKGSAISAWNGVYIQQTIVEWTLVGLKASFNISCFSCFSVLSIILGCCLSHCWSLPVGQGCQQVEHPQTPHQVTPRTLGILNCSLAHKLKWQSVFRLGKWSNPLMHNENLSVLVANWWDTRIPTHGYSGVASHRGQTETEPITIVPKPKPRVEVSPTISSQYLSTSCASSAQPPERWHSMAPNPWLTHDP